jgi:hypothetical protein
MTHKILISLGPALYSWACPPCSTGVCHTFRRPRQQLAKRFISDEKFASVRLDRRQLGGDLTTMKRVRMGRRKEEDGHDPARRTAPAHGPAVDEPPSRPAQTLHGGEQLPREWSGRVELTRIVVGDRERRGLAWLVIQDGAVRAILQSSSGDSKGRVQLAAVFDRRLRSKEAHSLQDSEGSAALLRGLHLRGLHRRAPRRRRVMSVDSRA